MKSKIIFGDKKLKINFEAIQDKKLKIQLEKAFLILKEDAFCGIQIPKKLIPREYIKMYRLLTNLWKYNLPGAWRIIYTIENNEVSVLSVLLEWLDHKNYERRFKY